MEHFNRLIVLVLVMITSGSFAQETKVGVRLGVGLPNLKSIDNNIYSKDYSTVAGFDGGIFMDYGLTDNFSIKTEFVFARKGGERSGMQPIPPAQLDPQLAQLSGGVPIYAEFDNRAVFSYLEIPILAKYEWSLNSKWGVYANAGFYVDFILSPKQETAGTSQLYYDETGMMPVQVPVNPQDPPQDWILVDLPPQDLTATTDIDKDLANMDFGGMFGIGFSYQITENGQFIFDARGSYGFIPLQNDTDTYGTVHMGSFTFSLGYAYTLKRKNNRAAP